MSNSDQCPGGHSAQKQDLQRLAKLEDTDTTAILLNGRYVTRTRDPFRVKEVRYHCANRPRGLNLT
jgi:hypothetical protein